jgi:hypothetical protein
MGMIILYYGGDFMACEECSKCWFNYVEKCEGQEENYDENVCKKKEIEKSQIDEEEKPIQSVESTKQEILLT